MLSPRGDWTETGVQIHQVGERNAYSGLLGAVFVDVKVIDRDSEELNLLVASFWEENSLPPLGATCDAFGKWDKVDGWTADQGNLPGNVNYRVVEYFDCDGVIYKNQYY